MSDSMDAAEFVARFGGRRGNKYSAKRIEVDGYQFASLAEGRRYEQLKLMVAAGEIRDLEPHPRFDMIVNRVRIGRYTGDFSYVETATGHRIVEDVKSRPTRTEAYGLRKNLMRALFGIHVREVEA